MTNPTPSNNIPAVELVDDLVTQATGVRQFEWVAGGQKIIVEVYPDGRCFVNGTYIPPAEGCEHRHILTREVPNDQ